MPRAVKGINHQIAGTSKKVRVNAMLFCKLVAMLMEPGLVSFDELADSTGLNKRTVHYWLAEMKRQKLIHVAGWGPDSRGYNRVPLWTWGNKKDVKQSPATPAERSARHRAKVKQLTNDMRIHAALAGTQCATMQ